MQKHSPDQCLFFVRSLTGKLLPHNAQEKSDRLTEIWGISAEKKQGCEPWKLENRIDRANPRREVRMIDHKLHLRHVVGRDIHPPQKGLEVGKFAHHGI